MDREDPDHKRSAFADGALVSGPSRST